MERAVIVSTARTPIGKAYRGAFNDTDAASLGGHAIHHALVRAKVSLDEVDDTLMGCSRPQGSQGKNIARQCAMAAGLPVTTPAMTVDRQCASGMMAIGMAAKSIMTREIEIAVAGGLESVSLVQNEHSNLYRSEDPKVIDLHEHMYMPMIDTAEVVADKYSISREEQDEYALQSQQRTARAQEMGYFDDEIVPMPSTMIITNKQGTKPKGIMKISEEEYVVSAPDMALLGNGSARAGAQKLDNFRKNLRQMAYGTTKHQPRIDSNKALQSLMRG